MTQLQFVMARLEQDRHLFAEVLSSVLTEEQLDSEPGCLRGLSIRQAWTSWSAGFTPLDKMRHREGDVRIPPLENKPC